MRLSDAKRLLRSRRNNAGAFYMAGYAIECAIKACIAHNMGQYPFPPLLKESDLRQSYYTHNLVALLRTANLEVRLAQDRAGNPLLDTYWSVVTQWSEVVRYEVNISRQQAVDIITAIEDPADGVLIWLKKHW
ncbi:MAG: hypothetical protein OHK0029_29000 [Armatimonadaceae bacterium]